MKKIGLVIYIAIFLFFAVNGVRAFTTRHDIAAVTLEKYLVEVSEPIYLEENEGKFLLIHGKLGLPENTEPIVDELFNVKLENVPYYSRSVAMYQYFNDKNGINEIGFGYVPEGGNPGVRRDDGTIMEINPQFVLNSYEEYRKMVLGDYSVPGGHRFPIDNDNIGYYTNTKYVDVNGTSLEKLKGYNCFYRYRTKELNVQSLLAGNMYYSYETVKPVLANDYNYTKEIIKDGDKSTLTNPSYNFESLGQKANGEPVEFRLKEDGVITTVKDGEKPMVGDYEISFSYLDLSTIPEVTVMGVQKGHELVDYKGDYDMGVSILEGRYSKEDVVKKYSVDDASVAFGILLCMVIMVIIGIIYFRYEFIDIYHFIARK